MVKIGGLPRIWQPSSHLSEPNLNLDIDFNFSSLGLKSNPPDSFSNEEDTASFSLARESFDPADSPFLVSISFIQTKPVSTPE